ncbi:MAG: PEP-CTERM sorting domain-containing protein [Planctomycetota bacterium]
MATPPDGRSYDIVSTGVGLPSAEVFFESDGVPRVGFVNKPISSILTSEPFIAEVADAGRRVDALVPAGLVSRTSFQADASGDLVYGLGVNGVAIGTRDGAGGFTATVADGTQGFSSGYLRLDSQDQGYTLARQATPDFQWVFLTEGDSGTWSAEVPSFLDDAPQVRSFTMVIDSSDRPVISHRDPVEGVTVRRRETSGDWTVLFSTGQSAGFPAVNVSLAAGPNGEIGFAYVVNQHVSVALIDAAGNVTDEVVSSDGETYNSFLDYNSLAFDANGDLALALTSELGEASFFFQTANDLLLARRTGPGQWAVEDTGLDDAYSASVAFDDQNNPYLAVVEYDAISLISPAILPALPGDATVDGVVDMLDFDALAANFGTSGGFSRAISVSQGDFNDDSRVDLLDFDVLARNFGAPGSSPAAAIPEPASLAAMGLAGLCVARRRR